MRPSLQHSRATQLVSLSAAATVTLTAIACGTNLQKEGTSGQGSQIFSAESEALCSTLNAALAASEGKRAMLREGAPVLPQGFWLTESDKIVKGSFLTFAKVSCAGEKVVLDYSALIRFKDGLLSSVKEETIQFRDEYNVGSDKKITGKIQASGRNGQLEDTGITFAASLAGSQLSYVTFLPFPLPVCPIAIGVQNFDKCRVRVNRRVGLTSSNPPHVQGFDKITIEALNKSGDVARDSVFQEEKMTFSTNPSDL